MKTMTKDERNKLIAKLERELYDLVDRIYDLNVGGRRLIPKYPYLLVRTLPKEHCTEGGIILPETEQNKPVYEHIVITTWRPWNEIRQVNCTIENTPNHTDDLIIHHESNYKPGDRIAAAHFEGISMYGYLDEKYYRLVREEVNQKDLPNCGVLGLVDYTGDAEVSKQIRKLSAKLYSVTTSGVSLSRGDTPPAYR